MGIAFTVDTPLKVARYGISSVLSIMDDILLEDMRAYYSTLYGKLFVPISKNDHDARARRITAFLDLADEIISLQTDRLKASGLEGDTELVKYLQLLSDGSPLKREYEKYKAAGGVPEKISLERRIMELVKPGSCDVNIMTKVDKLNTAPDGTMLPFEFSDALSALRGFAQSRLKSSVVLSAGFNPRLYSYIEQFQDFYPDETGQLNKKVILKVSDFRSASIQGKFLAKKGIWVSEFRIESGLNCGGHAFATDGHLLGPILEEFKERRAELARELHSLCIAAWDQRKITYDRVPAQRVSVQGGVGTAHEHQFLLEYYGVDSVGWGTPFLLVPEATTVDKETLQKLIDATESDLYLSEASPLGVPFNNLRQSSSEITRVARLKEGRPGSPCVKKYLVSNTEFTASPICTASRMYLSRKLRQLKTVGHSQEEYESVTAKACLCEDLSASAYIKYNIRAKIKPSAAVCPGPNLAFFSGSFSLKQMVDHIYGRISILNDEYRPNMFMNELKLYVNYFRDRVAGSKVKMPRSDKYVLDFRSSLNKGISYYKTLIPKLNLESQEYRARMLSNLENLEATLAGIGYSNA